MNKTILFIHSAGPQGPNQGSSNLINYLEQELENSYQIIHPQMPAPEDPKYDQWKHQLEKELSLLNGEAILIGHSLGGSVLLKYLSEHSCKLTIRGLFILASPYWGLDEEWQLADFMLQHHFADKLPSIANIFLYHSRNEKIVPFAHHQAYAKKLPQAAARQIDGDRHLFHDGLAVLVDDIKGL
ncbi:alpha/beta hydrolase [Gracilibacillus caseinilyticus]|uniref:Alpha/beta hydrolase n=1 Tax=Gracilibacillus caseinilyticus TaxID=2932256 RepID=A0ABY4F271_9BACI|nr:alpha/beta hydrolase [Gracilibacillus caseinilyticus]UOQ50162.1 alpha/beta hydrolase [Gracilibacillus caseinilyticus]